MARGAVKYNWKKVETEVLYSPKKIDYREIAEKYNIPLETVKKQAARHNWHERQKEVAGPLIKELERQRIKDFTETSIRLDKALTRITEVLLHELSVVIAKRQKNDHSFKPSELKQLIEGVAKLNDVITSRRGDTTEALSVLTNNGVIPAAIVPQVLGILEKSDNQLNEELSKAFSGRIPD